ncbi:hypothetical protein [Photobacterium indicum]|jgi:ASC-1-like (ASCH) protein|uniref:ASCH domain-containing protein n=1 Tax=Photobacterium indicum TaxID=81447 RepID=A0A2T3L931_9GAMM|nr:hypothetical protein [Photobacterium indicum]PSV47480.1 hypothetical protein C9J47_11420 [Photobacterium indicum]
MEYKLEIYRKAIQAIRLGKKKVEIRTNNSYESIQYDQLKIGDTILFQIIAGPPFVGLEIIEPDALKVKVVAVRHYPDARSLLEQESLDVLSTLCNTIEDGVILLNSFHEYQAMIPLHGIYAIEITL